MDVSMRSSHSWNVRVCAFVPPGSSELHVRNGETLALKDPDAEGKKERLYPGIKACCPGDHKGFCSVLVSGIVSQIQKGYNCCLMNYGNNTKNRVGTLIQNYGVVSRVARQMMKIGHSVKMSVLSVGDKVIVDELHDIPNTKLQMSIDDRRSYVLDRRTRKLLNGEEDLLDAIAIIEETFEARNLISDELLDVRAPAIYVLIEGVVAVTNNDTGTIVSVQLIDLPSPDIAATTSSVKQYVASYRMQGTEVATNSPLTQLMKQSFTTGGNTIWLTAHLGESKEDFAFNQMNLEFCRLMEGVSLPRSRRPQRSENVLMERLAEVEAYEARKTPSRRTESDKARIISDLNWIRKKPEDRVPKDKSSDYVRADLLQDSSSPYFCVLAPASRASLALRFTHRFTVFGKDPWRKKWVSVVGLKGNGIAANHATVMFDAETNKLVLCSFYGNTHINGVLLSPGDRRVLRPGTVVQFGNSIKYRVVYPPKCAGTDSEFDAADHALRASEDTDSDFIELTKRVMQEEGEVKEKELLKSPFDTEETLDSSVGQRSDSVGRSDSSTNGRSGKAQDQDLEAGAFIETVLGNTFDGKEDTEVDRFVDKVLGSTSGSQKARDEVDKLLDDIISGRMPVEAVPPPPPPPPPPPSHAARAPAAPSPVNSNAAPTTSAPAGKRGPAPPLELDGSTYITSPIPNKTKVFVSMFGCHLTKTMLVANDANYDNLLDKVENKLNQAGLGVFFEDPDDGQRVEIEDDDNVNDFLARARHDARIRLLAFPAELGARLSSLISTRYNPSSDARTFTGRSISLPPPGSCCQEEEAPSFQYSPEPVSTVKE